MSWFSMNAEKKHGKAGIIAPIPAEVPVLTPVFALYEKTTATEQHWGNRPLKPRCKIRDRHEI